MTEPVHPGAARSARVAAVIEALVSISKDIAAERRTPFAGEELHRSHLAILFTLAHSATPVTSSRLAAVLHVTAGAVTQLLAPLRAAGLVETVAHPKDARSRILHLTSEACVGLAEYESTIVAAALPRFAELTDTELHQLATLLKKVTDPP